MIDDLLRPTGPGPRPPADGFVQALRDARRRRWRTLRTNAACATAAAVAVVAALVPRLAMTSFAGLEPTTPVIRTHPAPHTAAAATPTPSRAASPTAEPRDPVSYPAGSARQPANAPQPYVSGAARGATAGPYAPATAGPGSGAGAASDENPPPQAEPRQTPTPTAPAPTPTPEPPPSGDSGAEPVDLSYEDQPVDETCQGSTWCWSAQVAGSYTLRLRACRGASDTTGVLRFGTEQEADFRILREGTEVWRWSTGQPDDDYLHDVSVDRWRCAVWSTPWHGVTANGTPVAEGTYRLDAMSRATSVPVRWWSTSFTVT